MMVLNPFSKYTSIISICIIGVVVISIVVKYIIWAFTVFCMLYTCNDLYHKRKKYIWLLRLAQGSTAYFLLVFVDRDELPQYVWLLLGMKQTTKRRAVKHVKDA
jgi:hypothetical protein